jgi:hypothetical protein
MAKNSVNNTVDLEIIQPGATIEKATIQGRMHNNQIQFYQTEKKIRSGSDLTSILQFIGALDDVRNSTSQQLKDLITIMQLSRVRFLVCFGILMGQWGIRISLGMSRSREL